MTFHALSAQTPRVNDAGNNLYLTDLFCPIEKGQVDLVSFLQ